MVQELTPSDTLAVAQMKRALSKLETEEGRRRGFDFKPSSETDVIVATPPKCGTTWVQHIVHALRSNGDMEFEEISCVVPFLEMAWDIGIDITAPQKWTPSAFKTHFYYPHCPTGCKKIFVIRDIMDVGPSFYYFFNGWFFEPDTISMDQFLGEFFLRRGEPPSWRENTSTWHNLISWYPHRNDSDVLWLHFEDLKEHLADCVALISQFIGCGGDDKETQKLVVKMASFEFMSRHPEKFDEHVLKQARNGVCGLPATAGLGTSKVRSGSSGSGRQQLSEVMAQAFHEKWAEVVQPVTGASSYQELREAINKELNRPWLT